MESNPSPLGFDEYVAARAPALLRFAFVLTDDAYAAEDLLQGALLQAHRSWARVASADHPEAYVRKIIVNCHISTRRRQRVRELLLPHHVERPTDGRLDDPADRVSERDELRRALKRLPPQQRAVLVLRHYVGYDDARIAETLDCTVNSVRVSASRGVARLRQVLADPATVPRKK